LRTTHPLDHLERRSFIRHAVAGTAVFVLGAWYLLDDERTARAQAQTRSDGRPRLPPGQRVLSRLKPMGGDAGDPDPSHFELRVHGEVERPFSLRLAALLKEPQTTIAVDVHCVTGWSALGVRIQGVQVKHLAEKAGVKPSARHVIFEAAHGYTSNVRLREALSPNVVVAHQLDGRPLERAHGAPVRAIVPDLYFWKSAKWLTGIRFVEHDEPGYWETRGYNNHADPWREERYS
jgi:DMSO/TMAO reductase YedYZ molybdopterin-dependent catalytic subunit